MAIPIDEFTEPQYHKFTGAASPYRGTGFSSTAHLR